MRIRIFLVIIGFAISSLIFGQDSIQKSRNITIKLPLTSLIGDIYATSMGIGLGVEIMIKPSLSLSQEITYIFHVQENSMFREYVENINGVKLTTEIRKYLSKKEIPESGWFVNAELKNIYTQSIQDKGRTNENNIIRYRGGLTANLGMLVYWDQHKKGKITLEIMAGGGLAYLYANSSNKSVHQTHNVEYGSANKFYPWVNFDFKIGYILK